MIIVIVFTKLCFVTFRFNLDKSYLKNPQVPTKWQQRAVEKEDGLHLLNWIG